MQAQLEIKPSQTVYRIAPVEKAALLAIALIFVGQAVAGIGWGLPGKHLDPFLFGEDAPWTGERIQSLAGAGVKLGMDRGADVDADPLAIKPPEGRFVMLNESDEDIAKIYLRYRLYSNQPDEMITLMSLAGMRPRELRFDPRLYQYGGLWIYPVGALIKLCGLAGWIEVRSDVVYYLDHPDAFAKFYLVSRAYAAAWGLLGLFVVFGIARRLAGVRAGLLASLLFSLLPVVVCMSHEGKPHLPGAVLMLLAVYSAMRHIAECDDSGHGEIERSNSTKRWWILMCVFCGASVGMVLSSAPIGVLVLLIPFLNRNRRRTPSNWVRPTLAGVAIVATTYLVCNPYILINALVNREVLKSNFGNSLAMYEVARIGEGFLRVMQLTFEGATLPVTVVGLIAACVHAKRVHRPALPLYWSAGIFFLQFVLIGAGKPGEYGRFGVFTNSALAIATSCLLMNEDWKRERWLSWVGTAIVAGWVIISGVGYMSNFLADQTQQGSRLQLARAIQAAATRLNAEGTTLHVGVFREPAPYGCPPMDFRKIKLALFSPADALKSMAQEPNWSFLEPVDEMPRTSECISFGNDRSRISWANKLFQVQMPGNGPAQ